MKNETKQAVLGLILLVIDQVSKFFVYRLEQPYTILLFTVFPVQNFNGSFSIPTPLWLTVGSAVVVMMLITGYMTYKKLFKSLSLQFSITLVISGGFSNVLDRIIRHSVTDIFTLGRLHWNIADILIITGLSIMLHYVCRQSFAADYKRAVTPH